MLKDLAVRSLRYIALEGCTKKAVSLVSGIKRTAGYILSVTRDFRSQMRAKE